MERFKRYFECFKNDNINSTIKDISLEPVIDLNKVSIQTNLKTTHKNNYPKTYTISLFYDNEKMHKDKKIESGGYGDIFSYYLDIEKEKLFVVVKKIYRFINLEPEMLNITLKKARKCFYKYVIPVSIIYDQHNNPFTIMQKADGDLFDLLDHTSISLECKINMIKYMLKVFECFDKNKICYSDLKTENILYLRRGDKLELFLGDIGSFVEYDKDKLIHSYLPPEYLKGGTKKLKSGKALTYYCLGGLFLEILDIVKLKLGTEVKYQYDYYKTVVNPKLKENINRKILPKKIKFILLNLIEINPKLRTKYSLRYFYNLIK